MRNIDKFAANELGHQGVTAECLLKTVALIAELRLLTADLHLFKLGQIAQLEIENSVCLNIGKRKTRHQFSLWLVFLSDDSDNLINIEVGNQIALKDVQSLEHFLESILQASTNSLPTELHPVAQQLIERANTGTTIHANDIEVHAVRALEVGSGEQVTHHCVEINAV